MRIGRHRLVLAFSILLAVVYGASREDAVTRHLERGQLGRRHLTPPALPAREPHRWPFTPPPLWHSPRNGSRGQPFKVAAFPDLNLPLDSVLPAPAPTISVPSTHFSLPTLDP